MLSTEDSPNFWAKTVHNLQHFLRPFYSIVLLLLVNSKSKNSQKTRFLGTALEKGPNSGKVLEPCALLCETISKSNPALAEGPSESGRHLARLGVAKTTDFEQKTVVFESFQPFRKGSRALRIAPWNNLQIKSRPSRRPFWIWSERAQNKGFGVIWHVLGGVFLNSFQPWHRNHSLFW